MKMPQGRADCSVHLGKKQLAFSVVLSTQNRNSARQYIYTVSVRLAILAVFWFCLSVKSVISVTYINKSVIIQLIGNINIIERNYADWRDCQKIMSFLLFLKLI